MKGSIPPVRLGSIRSILNSSLWKASGGDGVDRFNSCDEVHYGVCTGYRNIAFPQVRFLKTPLLKILK